MLLCFFIPAVMMALRSGESIKAEVIAVPSCSGCFASTRIPAPSDNKEGRPPTRLATTGVPVAIASNATSPNPSM